MPKKSPKFITEYLIPSLNSQRFGDRLKWLDKKKSIFQLVWKHKGVNHWSEGEVQVFVEWDKIKGHYQPNVKQYFSQSKQRFRALLYKSSLEGQLQQIECDSKSIKVYCITGVKKPGRKRKSSNADSGVFSTDDMSSDDNDIRTMTMSSEDANGNEMDEACNVNSSIHNLDDHNYSKCLIYNSDLKDTRVERLEDVTSFTISNEFLDTGKKVLVEQNFPYFHNGVNKFVSKDKNIQTDVSQYVFLEGLEAECKNAGNDGSAYDGFHYCNTLIENIMPAESTETLGNSLNIDTNVQFEKFLSDLNMDEFSNLNTFGTRFHCGLIEK